MSFSIPMQSRRALFAPQHAAVAFVIIAAILGIAVILAVHAIRFFRCGHRSLRRRWLRARWSVSEFLNKFQLTASKFYTKALDFNLLKSTKQRNIDNCQRFLYLDVEAAVVTDVLGFWVEPGFVELSGILLGLVQVHEGHVVLVVCLVVVVMVLGLSVHVGHVVDLVVDVVIGEVGRGIPFAASLWVVNVGAWGVTGWGGRSQFSEIGVDNRPEIYGNRRVKYKM